MCIQTRYRHKYVLQRCSHEQQCVCISQKYCNLKVIILSLSRKANKKDIFFFVKTVDLTLISKTLL